ncbi:MAG: hypothetical protein IT195_02735 [Microthrixaceae bacterium]|nr:hypothetical protein [Microthrixaceae bacterium]
MVTSSADQRGIRRDGSAERERSATRWPALSPERAELSIVFTTQAGGLVNRQAIANDIGRAARTSKIDPVGIATHTGRRIVITAQYANRNLDLGDMARHVGHSDTKTTAGYVRDLGERPAHTAATAARLLDPTVGT